MTQTLEALRLRVRDMENRAGIPVLRTVTDLVIRDAYRIGLEQRGETTFVHVQMRQKWVPRVARQFSQDIDTAQELLGKSVYALDDPANRLLQKFLTLHHFVPHSRTLDIFGRDVAVFERKLGACNGRRRNFNQHSNG